MPRRVAAVMLLAFVSGCASIPTQTDQAELLPMAQPLGPARRIVQQITATWLGRHEALLCILELDHQHIAIAGLSNDGISLFNLSYDGKKLVMEKSPLLPENVSPERIIKDLQLAFWPLAEIKKTLPLQWRLEADKSHRRLIVNDEVRVDINYLLPDANWPKIVDLTNHRYHYQLHIETVSYETLPE